MATVLFSPRHCGLPCESPSAFSWVQRLLGSWGPEGAAISRTGQQSTPREFEPLRAEPNRFLVHHLSHSVTVSCISSQTKQSKPPRHLWSSKHKHTEKYHTHTYSCAPQLGSLSLGRVLGREATRPVLPCVAVIAGPGPLAKQHPRLATPWAWQCHSMRRPI